MPKTRFTPGPWDVGETSAAALVGDIYVWNRDETVAVATITEDDCSRAEALANANLIAAAPEMFEALDWFLDSFSQNGEFNAYTSEKSILDLLALARAATRKARHGGT